MARNVALKVTLSDAQAKTLAKCLNRMSLTDFSQVARGKGQERELEAIAMREVFEVVRKALLDKRAGFDLL